MMAASFDDIAAEISVEIARVTGLSSDELDRFQDENPALVCSVSYAFMNDPVIVIEGQTYERKAIEAWLKISGTNPATNTVLPQPYILIPNLALKEAGQTALKNFKEKLRLEAEAKAQAENPNAPLPKVAAVTVPSIEAVVPEIPEVPAVSAELDVPGELEVPAELGVPAVLEVLEIPEVSAGYELASLLKPDDNLSDIEQQRLQRLIDIRRELTVYEKLESLPDHPKARFETVRIRVDEAIYALDPYSIHQSYSTLDTDWVEQAVLHTASAQNFVIARLYQIEGQINGKDLSDFEAFLTSYNVADSHSSSNGSSSSSQAPVARVFASVSEEIDEEEIDEEEIHNLVNSPAAARTPISGSSLLSNSGYHSQSSNYSGPPAPYQLVNGQLSQFYNSVVPSCGSNQQQGVGPISRVMPPSQPSNYATSRIFSSHALELTAEQKAAQERLRVLLELQTEVLAYLTLERSQVTSERLTVEQQNALKRLLSQIEIKIRELSAVPQPIRSPQMDLTKVLRDTRWIIVDLTQQNCIEFYCRELRERDVYKDVIARSTELYDFSFKPTGQNGQFISDTHAPFINASQEGELLKFSEATSEPKDVQSISDRLQESGLSYNIKRGTIAYAYSPSDNSSTRYVTNVQITLSDVTPMRLFVASRLHNINKALAGRPYSSFETVSADVNLNLQRIHSNCIVSRRASIAATPRDDEPSVFSRIFTFLSNSKSSSSSSSNSNAVQSRSMPNQIDIILEGYSGTGKSCLLRRIMGDAFTEDYISTIGMDLKSKTIALRGEQVRLHCGDVQGGTTLEDHLYQGNVHVIIVCYDVSDSVSFDNVYSVKSTIERNANQNVKVLLVANKIDLENRVISEEEGRIRATALGFDGYIETSAKTGQGCEAVIFSAAELLVAPAPSSSARGPRQ